MRRKKRWIALIIAFAMMAGVVGYQVSMTISANELYEQVELEEEEEQEAGPIDVQNDVIRIQEIE